MIRSLRALASIVACSLAAAPAFATDGGSAPPPPPGGEGLMAAPATPTYYESVLGAALVSEVSTSEPALPTELAIDEATATAAYDRLSKTEWELRIEGFHRRHEQVDGIYDMVLVLALPAATDGTDGFEAEGAGVLVEEGGGETAPLVYGGEAIVLKRNVGLEKTLLASVSGKGGLPDLAGTGYRWTAWNTIVRRDAEHPDTVTARGSLRYAAAAGAPVPDAADARFAAYLVTWIPGLPASIPPFAVRMDVQPGAQ